MSTLSEPKLLSNSIQIQPRAGAEKRQQAASLNIQYFQPSKADVSVPTIIFLPFWGGSASTFKVVQLKLSETHPSHTSVAASYRGTGLSERDGQDSPGDHSIPALAADVLTLLESLQSADGDGVNLIPSRQIIFCVHSMSAKVAWEVLRRLSASASGISVTALLLLAPAPVGPLELPEEMREQQLKAYESIGSATWILRNVLTHKELSDEVIERLASDCVGMSPGAKQGWIEFGMKSDCSDAVQEVAGTSEANGKLKSLRVSVLVGAQDQVETPEKVKRETGEVLSGQGFLVNVRVVADVGHLLPIEAPDEVAFELSKLL